MPFDIKPVVDTAGGRSYNLDPGGDWSWLGKQDYAPERAFASIGNYSRGKILGGPTFQQFLSLDDPRKFTTVAAPPPLTTAVLDQLHNTNGGKKIGQLSLDLIDPFGTMAEATGSFLGQDQPAIGTGGGIDPGKFLAEKGIDLFGAGSQGVPARLADYALALPAAVLAKMNVVHAAEPSANAGLQYRFQQDPGYWALLQQASDDQSLRVIANAVAAKYIDPGRNQYLVQQLFQQMKTDRDTILTARSSGNDRIDYIAKWRFASDLANTQQGNAVNAVSGTSVAGIAATLLSAIPFAGTQIASGIAPIDVVNEAWNGLTPEQRRTYFGEAGLITTGLDFVVQLPLLSGMGSALAIAKGSTGLAHTLYRAYDTGLRATALMMGSGLVVATANWAAEAAWPGYSAFLGEEIDRARPVSSSSLAGVVNELGFWASGSFGVVPAVQVTSRGAGRVFAAAGSAAAKLHLPHIEVGDAELAFFRDGYGGSMVRNELGKTGMPASMIETPVKASFLSHMLNLIERQRREPLEAALRGEQTDFAHVNAMNPVEREAWANDQLARGMQDGPTVAEAYIRTLAYARRKRPVIPNEEVRRAWNAAAAFGRTVDETLGADVLRAYGPDFIASKRVVGTYQAQAMEDWARKKVADLGYDGTKLGKHGLDGWAQIVRTLHQIEYHNLAGELAAAIEKEATAEAGKLAIIASDHVFRDEAEALAKRLETASADEAHALIADMIASKREAADWFARHYQPKAGHAKDPRNVAPSTFAAWLEDATPALPTRRINAVEGSSTALEPVNVLQRQLDTQGTWTLAFKPVDENGNFVSYARGRDGSLIKSPWVEYPITGGDNLELGNRGYLASKVDSVTRGFRTRRLAEFQRGQIFRIVTKDANVLPEQIDAFHEGLLQIAHDRRIQVQTAGAIAKLPEMAFGHDTRKAINDLAEKVFGPGDLPGRNGAPVKMDWPTVVAKAYRQSFKLNLSAGLTSYLKTLGPAGAAAAVASDVIYTAWRFGFSPLFKLGEIWESIQLNAMRGVFRRDPATEALYVHGGLGNDGSLIASEIGFDNMTQALTSRGDLTPSQRLAAAMTIHARHLPEDLGLQRSTAAAHAAADSGDLSGLPPVADNTDDLLKQLHETLATEPPDPARIAPVYTEEGGLQAELASLVGENGIQPGLEFRAKEILDRLDQLAREKGDGGPVFQFEALDFKRQQEWIARLVDSGDLLPNIPPGVEIFHHGTPGPRFERFDNAFMRQRAGLYGPGVYLTADSEVARGYRKTQATLADNQIDNAISAIAFADKDHYFTQDWLRNEVDHANESQFMYATTSDIYYLKRRGYDYALAGSSFQTRLDEVDMALRGEDMALVRVRRGVSPIRLAQDGSGGITPLEDINPWDIEFADKYGQWMPLARKPTLAEAAGVTGAVLDVAIKKDLNFIDLQNPGDVGRGPLLEALQRMQEKYPTIFDPGDFPSSGDAWLAGKDVPASAWAMSRAIDMVRNNVGSPLVEALDEVRSAFNSFAAQMYTGGPGAEASYARYFNNMWDEVLGDLKAHGFSGWAHEGGNITGGKKHQVLIVWDAKDVGVIPSFTPQEVQDAFERFQRRPGNAADLADVAGTPEALFDTIVPQFAEQAAKQGGWRARAAAQLRGAGQTAWHPTGFKQDRALALQIKLMDESFPALLRASGNDGVVQVFRQLGIREDRWATWLLEDRRLLNDWLNSNNDPAKLGALLDHAGGDPAERAAFNDLYTSPEWSTITSLWSINLAATRDEAFGVHFFSPYRSAAERSLNHPVLGVYPASWTIKAAREWTKFLFDNRTFGELRLGMAPAQAIASIARAQAAGWAETHSDTLDHFLTKGPLGSTIFIFNLLMPGDWSSLPFPLSRSIREVLRGDVNPAKILAANLDFLGVTRDAQLLAESVGEIHDLIFGKPHQDPKRLFTGVSVRGIQGSFGDNTP